MTRPIYRVWMLTIVAAFAAGSAFGESPEKTPPPASGGDEPFV